MLEKDAWQVVGATAMGVMLWGIGYLRQRGSRRPDPLIPDRFLWQWFRAPQWLVRLCGQPAQRNTLDLAGTLCQVTACYLVIAAPLLVLFVPDVGIRVRLLMIPLVGALVGGPLLTFLIGILKGR